MLLQSFSVLFEFSMYSESPFLPLHPGEGQEGDGAQVRRDGPVPGL